MPKKLKIISVVSAILLIAATCGIFYLRSRYVAPVLMYHSINPEVRPLMKSLIVLPRTFEFQMRFLREHGYNIMPLEELADGIAENKLPPKAVAITFDDGYKDFYTYAFPVIKKHRIPVTMFLIVDEIGRKENDRLSWGEIKEMQSSGLVTFGSHAMGPDPLIKIKSEVELKRQIFDSRKTLEDKLIRKVNMFSYPEGFLDQRIKGLVMQAGYKLAVATKTGNCYSAKDLFALKRVRISEKADTPLVMWFKASGYHAFAKDKKCK
jgi:peptidoglycan/xylan/chitin deacetylase (PgdA/CDA1 family)